MAESYLPDLATIHQVVEVDDGSGGFVPTPSVIETGVPILVEAIDDSEAIVAAAPRGAVTHKLYMRVTANTIAINPAQEIVVAARDGKAAMTFQQPKRLDESFEALVTVAAVLVF